MERNLFLIVLGMALVTYIPRSLPFLLLSRWQPPDFLQGVLENVRYAVLGALIIPGIFFVNEDPRYGIIGGLTATVLSFLGVDLTVIVLTSIGILAAYSYFLA